MHITDISPIPRWPGNGANTHSCIHTHPHSTSLFVLLSHTHLQPSYCIAGNFRGRNFCQFRGFVAICESFLHEIWGHGILWCAKASNLRKFSLQKMYFHQFAKVFSLESFSLYGIQSPIHPCIFFTIQ